MGLLFCPQVMPPKSTYMPTPPTAPPMTQRAPQTNSAAAPQTSCARSEYVVQCQMQALHRKQSASRNLDIEVRGKRLCIERVAIGPSGIDMSRGPQRGSK